MRALYDAGDSGSDGSSGSALVRGTRQARAGKFRLRVGMGAGVLLGVLLLRATALADVEMTQRLEGAQEGVLVTRFQVDGGKVTAVRVDQSPEISLITNFKKKRVIALHHTSKLAVVTKFRKLKKKAEELPAGKVATATGKEETLGETEAVIYEGTLTTGIGPAKATFWVAKNDSRQALLLPLVRAYAESPVVAGTPGLAETLKALPGVIVKSEVTVRDQSVITHLVSATEKEVAKEVYEVPDDYQVKKQ